jgi:hypothetical protein
MDEATWFDKLRKIEALHMGATTEGERDAARAAAERIRARLAEQRARDPDVIIVYSLLRTVPGQLEVGVKEARRRAERTWNINAS